MCGSASAGIMTVKFILSPPTWFTNSPIIGVVATTLIFLSSIAGQPASSELPPEQATKTIESAITPNLKIALLFKAFLFSNM